MPTTLITSRDDKGRHATHLFEVEYDKAKLDEESAQLLNERGGELQTGIAKLIRELTLSNQFAKEEVASTWTYPPEYKGPRPIAEQIAALAKIFDLDPAQALEFAKTLPALPEGAEGWFAIPSVNALSAKHFPEVTDPVERYCQAVNLVFEKIGSSRRFTNYRQGEILADRFRLNTRTANALDLLAEKQPGDILIVAAQFGMRHRGRSVRRAREVLRHPEFGLGSLAVGSMLLTHPERLVRWEQLHIDCPGDEFAPDADGQFSDAPIVHFCGDEVGFDTSPVSYAREDYGSASGFLPQ